MPENETEEQEPQTNPEEETEETSEETPQTSEESDDKEKETPEKPEPTPQEKKLYARLQKEKKRRLDAERKNRVEEKPKSTAQEKKSAEKEAEDYLRRLMGTVLDERDAATKAIEAKEDEEYQAMLDDFTELDSDFDAKKFKNLCDKFKPTDEDAAWALWEDHKNRPTKTETKPKPKLPTGKKTTDKGKEFQSEEPKKKRPIWEVMKKAKQEHGIKE